MGRGGRIGIAFLVVVITSSLSLHVAPMHNGPPARPGDPGTAAVECDFLGRYHNQDMNHPDMEGAITGLITGLVEDTLPIRLTPFGATHIKQFDWWDPSYFAFARTDRDLRVGYGFFPVDTGLSGDPFHFTVHWQTTAVAPATGRYDFRIGSDDDSWMFVDGRRVTDQGGVHALGVMDGSVTLSAGAHAVDIYFAERRTDESAIFFEFTTDLECVPPQQPCPRSQGYWKNHGEAWPVDELVLGAETYDRTALLDLLRTPVRGDASLILAKQLIAAKLNVAAGSDYSAIADAIASARDVLVPLPGRLPFDVRASSPEGQAMVSLGGTLDAFNNGLLTGACK